MKQAVLTKQALERWSHVPREEKQQLLEELNQKPGAVIELDEIFNDWKDCQWAGQRSKGRIVSIAWGMNLDTKSSKRYLFKSDVPSEPKTE